MFYFYFSHPNTMEAAQYIYLISLPRIRAARGRGNYIIIYMKNQPLTQTREGWHKYNNKN
jgi:hypothetical protein